jgi:hypothetical protein
MGQRREVWTAVDQRIFRYVIAEAVRAPRGPLKGKIKRDRFRDRELVELAGETDDTIDIVWPDLSDTTVKEKIDAIVSAAGTGTVPPEIVLRLLLAAIGVRDADKIIEAMVKDGEFQWPAQQGQQPGAPGQPAQPGVPGQPPAVPGQSGEIDALGDLDWGLFGGSAGAANPDGQPAPDTQSPAAGDTEPPAPASAAASAAPEDDGEPIDLTKFKPGGPS